MIAGGIVNKNTNLILFIVSFGSLLLLMLTRLDYVLTYGTDYQVRDTTKSPFNPTMITHPAQPDAQILGLLMVVLAIGSVIFLVKTLKK